MSDQPEIQSGSSAKSHFLSEIIPRKARIVAWIAFASIVASVVVTWVASDLSWVHFFDNLHWTIGNTTGAVFAVWAWRMASGDDVRWLKPVAVGMITYALGQWVYDAQIAIGYTAFPAPSDLVYLWLGPCLIIGLWLGARLHTTPAQRRIIVLDTLTVCIAVLSLILALYLPKRGETDALSLAVMIAYPVTQLGATAIAVLMVLSLRLQPSKGWLLFIVMLLVHGLSWMQWNNRALDGLSLDALWINGLFSVSIMMVGWAMFQVRFEPATSPRWDRLCEGVLRLLPLFAVVMASLAVVFVNVLHEVPAIVHGIANNGSIAVIVLAAIRQVTLLKERDQLLVEQEARTKAEETLRVAQERWKFALESAGDGLWDWNVSTGEVYFSPRWKSMLGFSDNEFANNFVAWEEHLHPEDKAATHDALQAHLHGGAPEYQIEFRMRCKDGSWKWILARGVVIARDPAGMPLRMTGTHSDISEQVRAKNEIRQLNADLEQRVKLRTIELETVNKELQAFSYSVSHDLRAPLRAIDGFSQALLEDYGSQLDATARGYLQRVRNGSQRMGVLIDDMLKLSRVSRGEFKPSSVDLSVLAADIFAHLQAVEPQRKVELSIEPGLSCVADPGLASIMMENLLGNAWKYSGKKPLASIHFGSMVQDAAKVYFVRDNGAGFDMQYVGKLFGAFQRLHNREEFEGTGIGLATVQRIVHRHGGRIWAEAAPGEGATFYFRLNHLRENY